MWRIESYLDDAGAGAPYDARARAYDRLVRSALYNRIAWSTAPRDYAEFAARAIGSARGPLLEAAAGSAAATAELHARSARETVLVDRSRAMLEIAAGRIAAAHAAEATGGGPAGDDSARVRIVQADLFALPFEPHGFDTVLALGLLHLFDDMTALAAALRAQLAPGGRLFVAGLVAQTRRGQRYLELLYRAGEVAAPRTADELHSALGAPADFRTSGCMAYATLPASASASASEPRAATPPAVPDPQFAAGRRATTAAAED